MSYLFNRGCSLGGRHVLSMTVWYVDQDTRGRSAGVPTVIIKNDEDIYNHYSILQNNVSGTS